MTPKEKAIEIYNKYDEMDFHDCADAEWSARECALICVSELIAAFESLSIMDSGSVYRDFGHGYWRNVKAEIESIKTNQSK